MHALSRNGVFVAAALPLDLLGVALLVRRFLRGAR